MSINPYSSKTYTTQDEAFRNSLPETLYLSHYELAHHYNEWTPDEWRMYLTENQRFIMREVSSITEANARQALSKLSTGKLAAQDVAAIKQLLERSEQINSQDKDQRTFVMLQFDGTPVGPDGFQTRANRQSVTQVNSKNARLLYGVDLMTYDERLAFSSNDNRVLNGDGTFYFTDTSTLSELDKAYMRLFNPENLQVTQPLEITADDGDIQ